jgi:hypothetical protein
MADDAFVEFGGLLKAGHATQSQCLHDTEQSLSAVLQGTVALFAPDAGLDLENSEPPYSVRC